MLNLSLKSSQKKNLCFPRLLEFQSQEKRGRLHCDPIKFCMLCYYCISMIPICSSRCQSCLYEVLIVECRVQLLLADGQLFVIVEG